LKKLIVLFLVVVFTFTLAMTASASVFNPFCGGRVVWSYINSDATDDLKDNPVTLNHGGIKLLLRESLSDEATGTWANIGFKADGWPNDTTAGAKDNSINTTSIYDFGWKKIGGSKFNIWYSSWESEATNIGQGKIYNVYPTQFNEDNVFDRDASHCITIDYLGDNLVLSAIYEPDKTASIDENRAYFAATYKFDGGDVHAGYFKGDTSYSGYLPIGATTTTTVSSRSTEMIVGAAAKLGSISTKIDYLKTDMDQIKELKYNGTINKETGKWIDCPYDGGNIIQANVSFDDLKFDVTLIKDSKYMFPTDGGKGYQVRYSGFCDGKLSLVYKAMTADDDKDATGTKGSLETGNFSTAYIGYKFGIFETRLGMGSHGKDSGKDDYAFASCYANFW
jgi:hypothetical protein